MNLLLKYRPSRGRQRRSTHWHGLLAATDKLVVCLPPRHTEMMNASAQP